LVHWYIGTNAHWYLQLITEREIFRQLGIRGVEFNKIGKTR